MNNNLDTLIDEYLEDASEIDRSTARHLKEIIPKTTHLDESVLDQIINDFIVEIENDKDFKASFLKVCERYILSGDIIKAVLPRVLTRLILNDTKFLEKIAKDRSFPLSRDNIKRIVASGNRRRIFKLFNDLPLNIKKVVFATFNEDYPEVDPFKGYRLLDIMNMLALDKRSAFKEGLPLTAVSIRYRNLNDVVKRFPVFPDAGWYDKFYPSPGNDRYGKTKSLDSELKSMPEIVHENVKLADVIEDIEFLEEIS